MVTNVILQTFADWYSAYEFYCVKEGIEIIPRQNWHDLSLFDSVKLTYSHSVYNLTTKKYSSNTYQYIDTENKTRHIKVMSGVVSDWYTLVASDSIIINGEYVTWLSHDLETGTDIEYYTDVTGVSCSKYEFDSHQLLGTVFHADSLESLPSNILSELTDFPFANTIFSYGEKTYGTIVEFTYTERRHVGLVDVTAQ